MPKKEEAPLAGTGAASFAHAAALLAVPQRPYGRPEGSVPSLSQHDT